MIVSSNSLTISNVNDGTITHWAYAWSADGTDRFTTAYPGENLIIREGELLNRYLDAQAVVTTNAGSSVMKDMIPVQPNDVLTFNIGTNALNTQETCFRWNWYDENGVAISRMANTVNPIFQFIVPADAYYIRVSYPTNENVKIEKGEVSTIYTPAPSEDPVNAYPTYIGTLTNYSKTPSTNPADYKWNVDPKSALKKAWCTGENGEGFTTVYPGENLLLNSTFEDGLQNWNYGGNSWEKDTEVLFNGHFSVKQSFTGASTSDKYLSQTAKNGVVEGDDVVWSVWAKSDNINGKLHLELFGSVYKVDAPVGTEWKRISVKGKLKTTFNVYAWNMTSGTYWISEPKLEKGTDLSPYTPAPLEDPLGAIPKYIGTSKNGGEKYADYAWQVNPDYVAAVADNHISNVKEILESQIDVTAESILNTVSAAYQTTEGAKMTEEQLRSLITQTSSSWGVSLDQTKTIINDLNDSLNQEITARSDYMRFYSGTNTPILEIGTVSDLGGSAIKLIITNSSIGFISGEVDLDDPMKNALAYFEADKFKINKGIIVESLRVGNHEMQKMNSGHSIFVFVG